MSGQRIPAAWLLCCYTVLLLCLLSSSHSNALLNCHFCPAAAAAAVAAEPSVLRFLMLAYLLILKEACWVARKSVIRFRISAEARHVVGPGSNLQAQQQAAAGTAAPRRPNMQSQQQAAAALLGHAMLCTVSCLLLHPPRRSSCECNALLTTVLVDFAADSCSLPHAAEDCCLWR